MPDEEAVKNSMNTIYERPLASPKTWTAETLLENDGLVCLDSDCIAELDRVATDLRANPLPVEALRYQSFDMPACAATMTRVREQIEDGIGFAIVDRLPVDRLDKDTAKKTLLASDVHRQPARGSELGRNDGLRCHRYG